MTALTEPSKIALAPAAVAARPDPASVETLVELATNRLTSEASRRAYARAVRDFLDWHARDGGPLSKATLERHRAFLIKRGLAPATVNQRLSAIRTLADAAADAGLFDPAAAAAATAAKGVASRGRRAGNWLTAAQAQALLDAPDVRTRLGLRDRAILAVLLGCGLRRAEIAALSFSHVQQRDGRWAIVDLVGKGRRIRTLGMPAWTKVAIDVWAQMAGLSGGRIFRPMRRGDHLDRGADGMTEQAVWVVVKRYDRLLGLDIAPHDLRRTFAKLALKGQARLEQIQVTLGHASIQTTQRYLGTELDLHDAPGDRVPLRLR